MPLRFRAVFVGALASSLLAPMLIAQAPANHPSFEVASVKRDLRGDAGGGWSWQPGGRVTMVNMSVIGLIQRAYPSKVEPIGAPDWANTERFDIDARAPFDPNPEQQQELLRTLLAERFKFAGHFKGEERAMYELVLTRSDGRTGSGLHPIDIDCATYRREANAALTASGLPLCAYQATFGPPVSMRSGGRSMQQLGDALSGILGRPILDDTRLLGYYAFTLDFDENASAFTALQEQLGLKLVSSRGSIDGMVIDHVEHPTED